MSRLKTAVLDLLIPQVRCLNCNEPRHIDPGAPLCEACRQELEGLRISEGICPRCLSPWRGQDPCRYCEEGGMAGIEAAFSPYRYHGPGAGLVKSLKFLGVFLAAAPLISGMLDCLDARAFEAMVPVPLHRRRERARGFNQAALLCKGISTATHVPVLMALERCKATKPQSELPHHRRKDNVKDSFRVIQDVADMRILLVDDVRTTGHTARACAMALLEAGARSVCLLTATVAASYSSSEDTTVDTARRARS